MQIIADHKGLRSALFPLVIKTIASLIRFTLIQNSYSAPKDPTDPTTYNLPADYIYTEKEFGTFFYKSRGRQDASRADASCRADSARLPVPRTLAENNFYASLAGNQVWLGVGLVKENRYHGHYLAQVNRITLEEAKILSI